MNVSRRTAAGEVDPNDTRNKSQIYITSAGFKNHFSYKKQIQLLVWQIVTPGSAIVLGGTWRTPVKMGLLEKGFVREMKQDGTFSEVVFNREYESVWAGSAVESFFSGDDFDAARELKDAEYSKKDKTPKLDKDSWYVMGVDVGRNGDETILTVVKVRPGTKGIGTKHVVLIRTIENMPFDRQAVVIKEEWEKFQPKHVVIDANGVGFGLVDVLVMPTVDPRTKKVYPPFGLANDDKKIYKDLDVPENPATKDTLWMMKATNEINSEGYTNLLGQMGSRKLKFLVTERDANARFKELSTTKRKSHLYRQELLSPYMQTSILKDELMNMTQSETSQTFKLERMTKAVGKDRVSSLMYAMYVIKLIEDKDKRRRKRGLSQGMFFN